MRIKYDEQNGTKISHISSLELFQLKKLIEIYIYIYITGPLNVLIHYIHSPFTNHQLRIKYVRCSIVLHY